MFVLLVIWVFSFFLFLFTPRYRDISDTHAGIEVETSFATAKKVRTIPGHLSFLLVGATFYGFWELSKLT